MLRLSLTLSFLKCNLGDQPTSKAHSSRKLNKPRIRRGRDNSSEIAGLQYEAGVRIGAAAGGTHSVQIADWICKVGMIEQIEELSS